MAGLVGAELDYAVHLATVGTLAVFAGAILGGMLFSLTARVWTHIADRLAEKLDAHRAEQVLRLKAECWRLRVRASKGGV